MILTLDTYHLQLLGGQGHDLALDLSRVLLDIVFLYIQLRAHGAYHLVDSLFDIIHVLGVLGIVNIPLREFTTLYAQVVELLYQSGEHRFVQSHRRGSNHRTAFDISFQILGQVVKIGLLETKSLHLLVEAFRLAEQLSRVGGHVHKLVLLTEIGHGLAAHVQ